MNKQQMRAELAFILGVREGEADQDFQTSRLNSGLQRAYERVVIDGRNHGSSEHFVMNEYVTWPSGQETYTLPAVIANKELVTIYDVTESEPGVKVEIGTDVCWNSRNTLRWNNEDSGPGDDVDLRIQYQASAEELVADVSEPALVPPEHRMYIVWEAALYLRGIADDQVPDFWRTQHGQARLAYIKHVSRPKPLTGLLLATSTLYEEDF